ncbi:ATP-binding protein [Frankia sp. Cr2]|uniref:ATP-binding protein n=2 Tax=unclassified Frankia TaxID=2632575 RepID=UPI002AD293B2|nr:ATP-binding protein [Frankia sp. Cr2]
MDRNTVNQIIDDLNRLGRDSYRIEVKRARGGMPTSLHETLSAFSNADGGTILLGIDEKAGFAIVGLAEPELILNRFVTLCRSMDPPIAAAVDLIDIDGIKILAAQVPSLPRERRPCHLAGRAPWETSFVRMADGDRKLSAYEVQLLLENRAAVKHDATVVFDATIDDLDLERTKSFLVRVREQRPILSQRSDHEILRLLNVLRETDEGPRPTMAGLLTLGVFPQQYHPQLDVTVAVFPTPDPAVPGPHGERFLDNRSIDGPIPVLVRDTIAMLKRHMKQRSIISGLFRVDEWEYPEEVLREAIVNAIVHRDYSPAAQGAQVQIELYPDRLLIRNPGGLYGPLHVRDLGLGTVPASSRNPVLLKLLEDTPLEAGRTVCENRGTGIARIRTSLTEAGMEPPTFDDRIATFSVTFPNHTLLDGETLQWLSGLDVSGLNRAQFSALALARRGEILTNVNYRTATGVSDSRTATAQLQELRGRGLLVQEGNRGQATYRLGPGTARPADADSGSSNYEQVHATLSTTPMTRREIAERTGLTEPQVRAALARLQRNGAIELVGPPRSRHARWRRIEHEQ